MAGKNNGRVPGERRMSDAAARREYQRLVAAGNDAIHEVVADRLFARADRIAQHHDVEER